MTQVKRPLDTKIEGKVPPVEAKDAPKGDETQTGAAPDETEEKDK